MIFLSYASPDREYADVVREQLRSAGFHVWIDHAHLDLAEPIAPQLEAAIEDSTIVVLLLSPRSLASGWVAFELALRLRHGKPLIVYRVTDCFPFPAKPVHVRRTAMKVTAGATREFRSNRVGSRTGYAALRSC